MAYQVKMQEAADMHGAFQKYRISNGGGAYAQFSLRGGTVEQVVLCAEGEPRMPVLAAPGRVRFFMDGAEVSLPEECWTLADHGENWLLFAAGSEGADTQVLLRYAWMDHERLVLDIAAEGGGADRLTCRTDFTFTLGGGAESAYRLSLYGCQAEVTDGKGMLLPEANAEAEVAGQGLRPVAELVCPDSDMTMTAYSCFSRLHIARRAGIKLDTGSAVPCGWPQRVVYGFDRVYHGPNKVYPFAF